jgi:serine/threonine protein kinase/tetratricopeptide (TPR) repeat protein
MSQDRAPDAQPIEKGTPPDPATQETALGPALPAAYRRGRLGAGTRLGPYEVVRVIGAGGMGEVYRAHDSRLGRDVAVKVLPERFAGDPEALERFVREAQAVAALTHPNIVAIFDVGSDHDIAYTVTELLEGETLGARIRRGPLPWKEAVDIALAIAEALAAAHAKGLIHRDLKPENIFLTSDGRVKLLDFGVARWRSNVPSDDESTKAAHTRAGTVIGTLAYMSPEQARGEAAEAPSDIFSFGSVLYEMVTAKPVFHYASQAETLAAILTEQPPPASAIDPLIPAELDRIVACCLEKSARDRFQNVTLLMEALKGLRQEATSSSASRDAVAAAYRIDSIAVLPFTKSAGAPELEYLSDGITESLINSLSQLDDMRVVARSTVFRYKGQDVTLEAVGRALNVRAILVGRVTQRGADVNVQCELFDVAKQSQIWGDQYTRTQSDLFVVQEDIAKAIVKKLRLKLSHEQRKRLTRRYTDNSEAYELYLRGRFYWNRRTPEWMRKGIEHFQLALQKDPSYALAYAGVADCFALLGSYTVLPPKDSFPRARMAALKALELDKTLAEAHTSLGLATAFHDWKWSEAEKHFKRGIKLRPSYAQGHQWYALMLAVVGRTDEALASLRRALDLDPLSLPINATLGYVLHLARRYDAAIAQALRALEMDQTFALAHYWVGFTYLQVRKYNEAIESFEAAYRSARTLQSLSALGYAYGLAGQRDGAERMIAQIKEHRSTSFVSSFMFALVHLGLREFDTTFDWLEKGVDERDFWLGWLKCEPAFDPIRDHPRFTALLVQVGLA